MIHSLEWLEIDHPKLAGMTLARIYTGKMHSCYVFLKIMLITCSAHHYLPSCDGLGTYPLYV